MTELRPQGERHERRQPSSSPSRTLWYAPDLSIVDEPLLWAMVKYRQSNRTQLPQPRSKHMPLPAEPNLISSKTESGKQAPILDLDFAHDYYRSEAVPARGFLRFPKISWTREQELQAAFNRLGISDHASLYGNVQIDVPHHYVKSTQEGHGHLYIDVEMSNWKWFRLMVAFYRSGTIERGYFAWGIRRWGNFVRRPGIAKEPKDIGGKYSYGWLFKVKKK
jgi:hypothetical protein